VEKGKKEKKGGGETLLPLPPGTTRDQVFHYNLPLNTERRKGRKGKKRKRKEKGTGIEKLQRVPFPEHLSLFGSVRTKMKRGGRGKEKRRGVQHRFEVHHSYLQPEVARA